MSQNPKTSEKEPQGNNSQLLQKDYNVLLEFLVYEHSWSKENADSFTELVNHLLHSPYRQYVVDVITDCANNLRSTQNETILAVIKARQGKNV